MNRNDSHFFFVAFTMMILTVLRFQKMLKGTITLDWVVGSTLLSSSYIHVLFGPHVVETCAAYLEIRLSVATYPESTNSPADNDVTSL
jgi:hypothetical protein